MIVKLAQTGKFYVRSRSEGSKMCSKHDVVNSSHEKRVRLERIAHELAKDYVYFKLSKAWHSNCKEAMLLRRLGEEIEVRHELLLKNMCERLDINEESAERTFKEIADETFATGVNWGRIVVLYTFAGKMAVYSSQHNLDLADSIVTWVGDYVTNLSDWMFKAGGWDAFIEQFRDVHAERESFWWNGLLCTTLGLGTIAAAMLIVKN